MIENKRIKIGKIMQSEEKILNKAKRLTIRIPEELEKKVREEAVRRGTNINQTMLHMITEYLKNQNME